MSSQLDQSAAMKPPSIAARFITIAHSFRINAVGNHFRFVGIFLYFIHIPKMMVKQFLQRFGAVIKILLQRLKMV